ncbi:MAG: threonylcarbamoyl-AMP synthase [Candidatus Zixiibacteriota bacterium]|nr:MAG: threonylcarbamoyl-AMP synthase [candidate division Zixibacteria bacterium]
MSTRKTSLIMIDYDEPDAGTLIRAAETLRDGDLVIGPTETRYGLMARADSKDAVSKAFELKRRSLDSATAVFIRDYADAGDLCATTGLADSLARAFMPGPLTLVLSAGDHLSRPIAVDGKVGIRVSSSPFVSGLMEQVDFAVTATSANISGGEDCDTIEEIRAGFADRVALYVDCGPLSGPPSTVVDCTGSRAVVLREGTISREMIQETLAGVEEV